MSSKSLVQEEHKPLWPWPSLLLEETKEKNSNTIHLRDKTDPRLGAVCRAVCLCCSSLWIKQLKDFTLGFCMWQSEWLAACTLSLCENGLFHNGSSRNMLESVTYHSVINATYSLHHELLDF